MMILLLAGERIFNLERRFDNLIGISEDKLPSKFLTERVLQGKNAGKIFGLEPLLEQYYQERGWNRGVVSEEKLAELGLLNAG